MTAGASYNVAVLARVQGDVGALQATLLATAHDTRTPPHQRAVATTWLAAEPADPGEAWVWLRGVLVAADDVPRAQLEIRVSPPYKGRIWLGMVGVHHWPT